MLPVGIDAMSFYTSQYYLDLKDLALARQIDPSRCRGLIAKKPRQTPAMILRFRLVGICLKKAHFPNRASRRLISPVSRVIVNANTFPIPGTVRSLK
jgi:hypothetical protein